MSDDLFRLIRQALAAERAAHAETRRRLEAATATLANLPDVEALVNVAEERDDMAAAIAGLRTRLAETKTERDVARREADEQRQRADAAEAALATAHAAISTITSGIQERAYPLVAERDELRAALAVVAAAAQNVCALGSWATPLNEMLREQIDALRTALTSPGIAAAEELRALRAVLDAARTFLQSTSGACHDESDYFVAEADRTALRAAVEAAGKKGEQ